MKILFLSIVLALSGLVSASESTSQLKEICQGNVSASQEDGRSLIRESLGDIFRVTKDSEARGIQKFAALRFATSKCRLESVNELMLSVEPSFHICRRSTPRCVSALANLIYRMDNNEI
jgi:hypothetical protein